MAINIVWRPDEHVLPANLTCAAFPLPVPELEIDFRIVVDLNPLISVGQGPFGQRNWISFSGGAFAATWATGTIVPGGQDSQLVVEENLSTNVDTVYLLQTDDEDPAYIAIKTWGWRHGLREVMEKLFDPQRAAEVSPFNYSFRLYVSMETGDARYNETLNVAMWVGSGARLGSTVIYDAYRVM
ncbi:hypothetical protein B0I35DRAFT_453766 [Stachybotrys elegans]|uniref:Uncharacterized protein n=1 Tax=Stachybotrys elegans TaxID=80388 RepID=A0A8K0SHR0_9HYPO|nr:hypothetical protein B0I35DRAFT_453766 [Stachybotrys elegans]